MKVIDIADELYREINDPDDFPIPKIVFWLTSNIGKLTTLIATDITVDNTDEFVPELNDAQKEILKLLYYIYVYRTLGFTNLGAGAYDWTEVDEGDTHIRRVSKNEIAKSYAQLKKDIQEELDTLVFYYKQRQSLPASYCTPRILPWWAPYNFLAHRFNSP